MPPQTCTFNGNVFVPAVHVCDQYAPIQGNFLKELKAAGVQNLRCNSNQLRLTTYPTHPRDITMLQAVHIAVRTGDFYQLAKLSNVILFGFLLPKDVHQWLLKSPPGQPLQDIITWLAWLYQSSPGKQEILEAQLEPNIMAQVYQQSHKLSRNSSPWNSRSQLFEIPITAAYLFSSDLDRIRKGEKDTMQRTESRADVWTAWLQAQTCNAP